MADDPDVAAAASTTSGAVIVIARTPVPGRSKTRLTPPLTPEAACEVAWACLLDTLDVVASVTSVRKVLVLDGEPGPWIPRGVEVVRQRGEGLGERLGNAFTDVPGPAVVIAMDTPQVTPALLAAALATLARDADAVLGPAADGGYWLVGLRGGIDPHPVFHGVPMSAPDTGAAQRARLADLGLTVTELDLLRDIDEAAHVMEVAALLPGSRLAAAAQRHGAPLACRALL